ncbi:MAG: LEA type 2 family protein [Gammaproteobacteria bacterium]|nr:LEA type 2 family protein [Gammaproteobacteria bacterium]
MKTTTMARLMVVALIFGLSACESLPESLVTTPRVELRDVQVVGIGFKNQTFLLSFDVDNPNPFPLPVSNLDYGVVLDGERFASGSTSCDLMIPAGGATEFSISVELNLLQTAPQLLSIVRDSTRKNVPYELNGRLGVDLPMTPSINYHNSGTIQLSASRR